MILAVKIVGVAVSLLHGKSPFTEKILWVVVRRGKNTFHVNSRVNGMSKTLEFSFMHVLTDEFAKPSF